MLALPAGLDDRDHADLAPVRLTLLPLPWAAGGDE